MKFKRFTTLFLGVFLIGVSVGYVLGFYMQKYSNCNNLFYVSALIMGAGSYLLIYATLFLGKNKNGNKK